MSRLCFNKCITKPGASLDSTEQVNNILLLFLYILKITFKKLNLCFRNAFQCAWIVIWKQ